MTDMLSRIIPAQHTRQNIRVLVGLAAANPLGFAMGKAKPVGLLAMALLLLPIAAHAQTVSGGASPATMVNNVCTFILGTFGQSVAVLAIIGIGFAWMFGRASLGLIAGIVGGIIIMFGASYLGQQLTGG